MRMLFLGMFFFLSTLLVAREFNVDNFEDLMGKSTSHWRHVATAQDIDTLEWIKILYEKNKQAQFYEEGAYKIPSVIHFIWLGPRPFPPESVQNVRTWIAKHPGWKVKFWTDRNREAPCEEMEVVFVKNFPFLKLGLCYEQSQNWGEKSDLLRYEILFQEGGVYADHDANCLKSFSGMHRGYDFFCGLETPHQPFVNRSITCGNGVIGSRPRHPTLSKVMDLIFERWVPLAEKFRGNDDYSRIEIVMQRTYIALTDAVKETVDQNGNIDILFPAAYFFSKSGMPSLYSQHFFASAWNDYKTQKEKSDRIEERSLGKIRKKNHNLTLLLIGLIGFNSVVFWIGIIKEKKK